MAADAPTRDPKGATPYVVAPTVFPKSSPPLVTVYSELEAAGEGVPRALRVLVAVELAVAELVAVPSAPE